MNVHYVPAGRPSGRPGSAPGGRSGRHPVLAIGVLLAATVLAACNGGPLQFSPTTLPDAQVGTPYSTTITVSDNPTPVAGVEVAKGSLPAGLDATRTSGTTIQIAGTPITAGTYTFTISVWCYGTQFAGETGTQDYTLVVK